MRCSHAAFGGSRHLASVMWSAAAPLTCRPTFAACSAAALPTLRVAALGIASPLPRYANTRGDAEEGGARYRAVANSRGMLARAPRPAPALALSVGPPCAAPSAAGRPLCGSCCSAAADVTRSAAGPHPEDRLFPPDWLANHRGGARRSARQPPPGARAPASPIGYPNVASRRQLGLKCVAVCRWAAVAAPPTSAACARSAGSSTCRQPPTARRAPLPSNGRLGLPRRLGPGRALGSRNRAGMSPLVRSGRALRRLSAAPSSRFYLWHSCL
eukprot:SAG11_NODE_6428_length_1315_cov_2.277138_1_plen_271_part_00